MISKLVRFTLAGILMVLVIVPVNLSANDFQKHLDNGKDLVAKGDSEQAVLEYQNALKSKPRSNEARTGLGSAYEKWGDSLMKNGATVRAIEAYQKAVATLPGEPYCHERLGLAMEKNGDHESACKEFRVATFLFSPVDGRYAPDRNPVASRPDLQEGGCKVATVGEHIGNAKHGVTAPIATYHREPDYSDEAHQAKLEGTVVLLLLINPSGDVTAAKIVKPLGRGLDEEALKAVRSWKFRPALSDGIPVAVTVSVDITFRLY